MLRSLSLLSYTPSPPRPTPFQCCHCDCTFISELGALGSRLTGAGWGGSAVSLIKAGTEEQFLAGVRKGYYDKKPELEGDVDEALFATAPGQGASIIIA